MYEHGRSRTLPSPHAGHSDIVASLSMPGDASTIPLQGTATARRLPKAPARVRGRVRARAGAEPGVLAGALSLATIVGLSLLLVLVAANRPSGLTPTTHTGYFPRWMAGPLGGLLAGFTNNGTTLKWLLSGSIVAMYCAYALVLRRTRVLPARWVIGAILAVQAIFLLSPPLALTDLFNYINYGRMEVLYNLNPYTTIPILEPHSDPTFLLSNWHELLSPYGPLFTLVTFAVVPLGVAGSFWALKGLLALTSLATILLVWKCARMLGRDPVAAIALAGLNPVVLVWGLGGDHNDFLMVFCVVLGFYLMLRARERSGVAAELARLAAGKPARRARGLPARALALVLPLSALDMGGGAAFVTAVALKASAAVLIPVALAAVARAPRRLVQTALGMLLWGAALAFASLIAFGLHIPDLSTQSQLVTSLSVPNLLGLLLGLGGESAGLRSLMDATLLGAVAVCCWALWSRGRGRGPRLGAVAGPAAADAESGEARAITAAGWASMALLLTLSWVLPWYVVWVLPLAALSSSRRLRTGALLFGVYLIVVWAPASQSVWNAIGFHPEKTQLGRVHQRFVKELLD
jgi:hypothetical protein